MAVVEAMRQTVDDFRTNSDKRCTKMKALGREIETVHGYLATLEPRKRSDAKRVAMALLREARDQSFKDLGRLCCTSPVSAELCAQSVKQLNETVLSALGELEHAASL